MISLENTNKNNFCAGESLPPLDRNRLIVSADDFGISSQANKNILHLVSLGKIDRVAVMVDGDVSLDEIGLLIKSGVKLDVHLEMNRSSVENRAKQANATFPRLLRFFFLYISGGVGTLETERLWENQITKFHQLFEKLPDGINSHEHIHYFPPFFRITCALREKYAIPYIRFAMKRIVPYSSLRALIIDRLRKINQRSSSRTPSLSSDYMTSLNWMPDMDDLMNRFQHGSIEVVCHPEMNAEYHYIINRF
jgi:predicted glycoside hydrolase/deacetylase ChbG (UPF0249 family)